MHVKNEAADNDISQENALLVSSRTIYKYRNGIDDIVEDRRWIRKMPSYEKRCLVRFCGKNPDT